MDIDQLFEKWVEQHRKEMGMDLQYEEKYDLARAAFEAGYKLAVKDYEFFQSLK